MSNQTESSSMSTTVLIVVAAGSAVGALALLWLFLLITFCIYIRCIKPIPKVVVDASTLSVKTENRCE